MVLVKNRKRYKSFRELIFSCRFNFNFFIRSFGKCIHWNIKFRWL